MPTYTYKCKDCEQSFDLFHSISDMSTKYCQECEGESRRVISGGAGLIFKGSGFYQTDYKGKNANNGMNGSNGNGTNGNAPVSAEISDKLNSEKTKPSSSAGCGAGCGHNH